MNLKLVLVAALLTTSCGVNQYNSELKGDEPKLKVTHVTLTEGDGKIECRSTGGPLALTKEISCVDVDRAQGMFDSIQKVSGDAAWACIGVGALFPASAPTAVAMSVSLKAVSLSAETVSLLLGYVPCEKELTPKQKAEVEQEVQRRLQELGIDTTKPVTIK